MLLDCLIQAVLMKLHCHGISEIDGVSEEFINPDGIAEGLEQKMTTLLEPMKD